MRADPSGSPLGKGVGRTDRAVADVCLILEGSYPYVRGGVSSWVHQLIAGLPEVSFSLTTLIASEKDRTRAYELAPNVIDLDEVPLSVPDERLDRHADPPPGFIQQVRQMHRLFSESPAEGRAMAARYLADPYFTGPDNHEVFRVLAGREAWRLLLDLYRERGMEDCSFNAYYYTFLHTHFRIFRALSAKFLPARVYHAVSTGYAGLLGAAASLRSGRPLVLTEHGIYTNERNMEITTSEWLEGAALAQGIVLSTAPSKIRRVWMRIFEFMGALAYEHSKVITTLFEGNRRMQLELGADPAKVRIIPNGADFARLAAIPRELELDRPRLCLIGRVVPIKDIRTFVKAAAIVCRQMPRAVFEVLGPTEEDPVYYEECRGLANDLGISGQLHFRGHVQVAEQLGSMALSILTSMSEGLPLVMLETMACGIPNVASRVGACEELILGGSPEDRKLGPAGLVTGVAAPEETAAAILQILGDPQAYARMAAAARERVARYYDQRKVLSQYREMYRQLIGD